MQILRHIIPPIRLSGMRLLKVWFKIIQGQFLFYATASGKIAKDKWVNVGLKEYYCGSNGKITKTR
jgi:glucan-binding YG repeat protein